MPLPYPFDTKPMQFFNTNLNSRLCHKPDKHGSKCVLYHQHFGDCVGHKTIAEVKESLKKPN